MGQCNSRAEPLWQDHLRVMQRDSRSDSPEEDHPQGDGKARERNPQAGEGEATTSEGMEEEREGLRALWNQITNRLVILRRAERILTCHSVHRVSPIRKGSRNYRVPFSVGGERIPLLVEQPVRSLGRQDTAVLSSKHTKQLLEGSEMIGQCHFPGIFKVWFYQFTLYNA